VSDNQLLKKDSATVELFQLVNGEFGSPLTGHKDSDDCSCGYFNIHYRPTTALWVIHTISIIVQEHIQPKLIYRTPFLRTDSHSASQEFPRLLLNLVNTVFTAAHHWSLF